MNLHASLLIVCGLLTRDVLAAPLLDPVKPGAPPLPSSSDVMIEKRQAPAMGVMAQLGGGRLFTSYIVAGIAGGELTQVTTDHWAQVAVAK